MSKILVVDDSPIVLKIVTLALSSLGHTVVTASTGEEALKIIEESPNFDLGIFDYNLPNLGGAELISSALSLQKKQNFTIIVLSSESDSTQIRKGLDAGAVDWLKKPFDNAALIKKVSDYLIEG